MRIDISDIRRTGQRYVLFLGCVAILAVSCAPGRIATLKSGETAGKRASAEALSWYRKGCYERALEYFMRAYELFSLADARAGVAMTLNHMGTVYRVLGRYEEALKACEEAHGLYQGLNDPEGSAEALSNKAAALIEQGRLKRAEAVLQYAGSFTSGLLTGVSAGVLQNRAVLLARKGLFQEAERLVRTALRQSRELAPAKAASLNFFLGHLMLETNRPETAVEALKTALALDKQARFSPGVAQDLSALAGAQQRLGRYAEAVKLWKRAVKMFVLMGLADNVNRSMAEL
ncbi:MAG: tetratricopeptide repeat protein, partial [Deltaproteobacteria bacterium]|nr:tetratricopeptide repeat protein [Deltaproteobacteria bacterium]